MKSIWRLNPLTQKVHLLWATLLVSAVVVALSLMLFGIGDEAEAHVRNVHSWWLDCPRTTVTEGNSVRVFFVWEPPPGYSGDSRFGTWWYTDPGTAIAGDYVELPGRSEDVVWSTEQERIDRRQPRRVYTNQDHRVEHDETFTVRFSTASRVHDEDDPERDNKCEITIRNDDNFTGDIETSTDGTKVIITISEGLKNHLLLNWLSNTYGFPINLFQRAVFDVKVDNRWRVPSDATLSGRKITLTLDEPITEGQSVKVRYDNVFAADSVGLFLSGGGVAFPTFRATSGENRSTVPDASGGPGPWMPLDKIDLTLEEGDSGTFKAKLNKGPSGPVTVTISNYPTGTSSEYTSLTLDKDTLTFNRSNWNTYQEVTATANEDSDAVNFWSLVTLSASGGGYEDYETYVRVLVEDDELIELDLGSNVSVGSDGTPTLLVDEGGSVSYEINLKRRPSGGLRVSVDPEWSGLTASPSTVHFSPQNWHTAQTVTLTADADSISVNKLTKLTHTPSGSGYDDDHEIELLVNVRNN